MLMKYLAHTNEYSLNQKDDHEILDFGVLTLDILLSLN